MVVRRGATGAPTDAIAAVRRDDVWAAPGRRVLGRRLPELSRLHVVDTTWLRFEVTSVGPDAESVAAGEIAWCRPAVGSRMEWTDADGSWVSVACHDLDAVETAADCIQ